MSTRPRPHAARVLTPFKAPAFVPDKIHGLHQWIGWRERWNAKREKPDKLPARAKDGKGDGFLTPQGHSTYEEAVAAVETFHLSGVGLALMGGEIVGGDLDRCRNPINGELDAFAQEIVDFAETYCEVTPSGEGLRFFAAGELPGGEACVKYDPARVELYTSGRFLTFTGRHVAGTPRQVLPAPKTIAALVMRVEAFKQQDAKAKGAAPLSPPRAHPDPEDEVEAFRRFCYLKTPFGRINEAAMARLKDWVLTLFPQAEAYHDGYRVSSAALGRGLQEDISILPRGIKDFGEHDMGDPREGRRTPIDLVLQWEESVKTAKEAAQWLAKELDVPFEEAGAPPAKLTPFCFVEGKTLRPREWLVHGGWAPMRKVTLLQGDGGDGKTLLMQQLQSSCAVGAPWIGLPVTECVSLGFYTEDDEDDVEERQAAIDAHYGQFCAGSRQMHVFPRAGEENELVVFDKARRPIQTPFFQQMVEATFDLKARLIVLDVAVDLFGGNEIVRPEVRALFRPLTALVRKIDGAVIMTAHVSQSGIRTDGGHSGSTDWSNAARSRLYLNRPQRETGDYPDPNARVLTRKKANYATIGDTVALRWGRGVLAVDGALGSGGERPSTEEVFLHILDAMTREQQIVSSRSRASNFAPALFMTRPPQDRQGYTRADFEAAQQRLFRTGAIRNEPYGPASRGMTRIVRNDPI